jgi:hypothetical protein
MFMFAVTPILRDCKGAGFPISTPSTYWAAHENPSLTHSPDRRINRPVFGKLREPKTCRPSHQRQTG